MISAKEILWIMELYEKLDSEQQSHFCKFVEMLAKSSAAETRNEEKKFLDKALTLRLEMISEKFHLKFREKFNKNV